ncbi:MAG: tRNA 2-thiouridine(34) synthase MnmA [Oscillospiraceae bacterium]|nr:tRNA 2-thiouridine(34) synthase MnmA [Oscillospiraceae bacterium]
MLGMSGGVDSSAAALLLQKAGYEVQGVTLRLKPAKPACGAAGDSQLSDIEDARRVCQKLGMEHRVLDLTEQFEQAVIAPFAALYEAGRTPNPCVLCNPAIKFGAMLDYAEQMNFDYVATGHYARIEQTPQGRFLLKKSPAAKDQSYVLYSLSQHQLSHTLLPDGIYSKPEIRALAEQAGLPVAHKKDSQEICFVDDNDYGGFLERYTGRKARPGNFLDAAGAVIGRHRGVTHYTVGQRKGLGVSFGKPMYVTAIDAEHNTVTLGGEQDRYAAALTAGELNFIPFDTLESKAKVQVKVRYSATPAEAMLVPLPGGRVHVEFEKPQKSVAPGQAAVFYDGDIVLGGGTILTKE